MDTNLHFCHTTGDMLLGTQEDRLNLLPDSLLLEIISRLGPSTKEVIKTTSRISKRCQHLWTQLPTLAFVCQDDIIPRYSDTHLADYFSFIDKTLSQCPTDMNLNKFQLMIRYNSELVYTHSKSQVYSWIRHAITRNVQEIDLLVWEYVRSLEKFSYDDELFFNNSSFTSMKLSHCAFIPPNGAIRWDKLKCLCIDYEKLDEDSMGKILSGSPGLETLEFEDCDFDGCFTKSLFGKFGVERLSCDMKTYELLTNGDERFWDDLTDTSMKLSRCVFNPRNGWGNLNFLCIYYDENVDEDSIGKVLSGSPCLETLELKGWYGVRRIEVASNSVKNLVLYGYGDVDTLEIDAPNILSLTIKGTMELEKILLLNIPSLVKADFDYRSIDSFVEELGRGTLEDIEEELLKGLLTNLGHVNKMTVGNEITLGDDCLEAFSRLKKRGFPEVHSRDREEELVKGLLTNLGHVNKITLKNNCLEVFSRLKKRGFPELHSTSRKENVLNSSHSHRFYLLIIILLFIFWVAMVSNLLAD